MNIFEIEVHPAANIFPMIPKDELEELAADIRANGLIHPIVVKDGILIDGRNRRAACEIAGIEPEVVELNGSDPKAYIISSNINRRHMTKGQKAMAVAMIFPDPEKRGRGNKSVLNTDFSSSYLKHARAIYQYCREDKVDLVMSGDESLNEAYKEAMRRKISKEDKAGSLATLRANHPDLADLVDEGRMVLSEALAASDDRKRNDRANRAAIFMTFRDVLKHHEFLTREHKPTFNRISGHEEEFKKDVGMSVEEALIKFDEIQKSGLIKSYLENI